MKYSVPVIFAFLVSGCSSAMLPPVDACRYLFAYWGVEARTCSDSECLPETVYIFGRDYVQLNGKRVLGTRRGRVIEYDRTVPYALQLTTILHEIGHVLFPHLPHSPDRGDLMYASVSGSEAPKYPAPREYLLAREHHRGRTFFCLIIP